MIEESQNIEHKESWRDEYLKWICGFANAQGGRVYIGVEDDGSLTGVDRMFREMEEAGQPAPEYRQNEFMVYATIRQHGDAAGQLNGDDSVSKGVNGGVNGYVNGEVNSLTPSQRNVYDIVHYNPGINTKKIAEILKKSPRTIEKHIALLAKACLIEHRDSDKTGGYYVK